MRDIKFRAWDRRYKNMLNDAAKVGDVLYWDGGKCFTAITDFGIEPPYHDMMQFTGLRDKNGKDIYEGDIVKLEGINGEIWAVYWFYDRWCLGDGKKGMGGFQEDYDNGDYYDGDDINWDKSEIIGNIYENPELLTK